MNRLAFLSVGVLALFLILLPTAVGSTTWYVDGVNGNDGNNCLSPTTACKTIGHAISLASSGDTISVAAATYTENLTIGHSLTILGSGASTTIIDGGGVNTVVTVTGEQVTLSKFTLRNGFSHAGGGGIWNAGTLTVNEVSVIFNKVSGGLVIEGAGIDNFGSLTITNSTISQNRLIYADKNSGGSAQGAGINNSGRLLVNTSTVSGNLFVVDTQHPPSTQAGAGIADTGTLQINNSTITGNTTTNPRFTETFGGGIYTAEIGSSTPTISNSTIAGNSAATGGGGINGGAILQNTIVANNFTGGNCGTGIVTSLGYNMSSDGTCNLYGPGDLNDIDPRLGPLQNNGGPTQTQALLSGSPAIDAGNPSGCTDGSGNLLKTDQRGAPRPDKEDSSGCDMGAYEKQTD